ncbi:FAD-dependent oxidoreductase [Rothia sp. LK2588]|uniref:FAD-dependent oxidoreductase n=1 Tax=Rothia sp. LK2588 TaxID=3114369 RepID=UPI0034CF54A7
MKTSSDPSGAPRTIVIIGGVAGGMSTATRLRRLDENLNIVVLEKSGYVSFANCGLPYYVGEVITDRSALLLQTPQSLAERFALDVRVNAEATAIDRENQVLTVRSGENETYQLHYDQLVLSPGARPVLPPIPGIENAFTLRDIEDTDRIHSAVSNAKSVAIIGGGFIGVEVAENLTHRGITTHLIEFSPQVMAPLDPELASLVHDRLRDNGVHLHLNAAAQAITASGVTTNTGEEIPADVVIAAIGVRPETTLAQDAGLELGPLGGIAVNEKLQTSDPNIFAIGDAVEKRDGIGQATALVPLANTANRQGRVLADILCGRVQKDRPSLGTAIVGVFGLQVAATGWNEKRLLAAGKKFRTIHTHPFAHATYYPGAKPMALKLLVDPDTDAILGAQGVGEDGVDKRIDVIATAMAGGLRASDLADLELAYAPAYGTAKDALNMLGYVNQNLADGTANSNQWHELAAAQQAGATVIDVRSPGEFAAGAIPGAINIPVDELRDRLDEIPSEEVIVHCAVGVRGHTAARILAAHNVVAKNLDGGFKTWVAGQAVTQPATQTESVR